MHENSTPAHLISSRGDPRGHPGPLDLHVFFTPSEIVPIFGESQADDVYIVVDVIRATTTLSVMFDRGAARVYIAEHIEQARQAARLFPERLLCGERHVRPVPGFDYGNSPTEFARLDLSGRELILVTTNGTHALYACPERATRLAGCFYNAHAVTAQALALAQQRGGNIAIVCAGKEGRFGLDDAVCAGYLVLELQQAAFQHSGSSTDLQLYESAQAAVTLFQTNDPATHFETWSAVQEVFQASLYDDPRFCIQTNVSTSVPIVAGREQETGLLVVEKV